MSGPTGGDGLWIQMALFSQKTWIKQVINPSTERTAQPVPDGDPEPHLRSVNQFGRYMSMHEAAQDPLAIPIPNPIITMESPSEAEERWIKHRGPHLEAHGHRRPIDLC